MYLDIFLVYFLYFLVYGAFWARGIQVAPKIVPKTDLSWIVWIGVRLVSIPTILERLWEGDETPTSDFHVVEPALDKR